MNIRGFGRPRIRGPAIWTFRDLLRKAVVSDLVNDPRKICRGNLTNTRRGVTGSTELLADGGNQWQGHGEPL